MDKDAMIQAAESDWFHAVNDAEYAKIKWGMNNSAEEYTWHWFWLILAESIWPEHEEKEYEFNSGDLMAAMMGD